MNTETNSIYSTTQIFLEMNGIESNLRQVVGVSNKNEISKKYRQYKQNYYGSADINTLHQPMHI